MGKRSLTRLAAAVAGGALALSMAAPAFAEDGDTKKIPINQLNETGTTAEDFSPQTCDGLLAETGPDEDGWQFNAAGFTGDPEDIKWFLKLEDADGELIKVTNEDLENFEHEIIKPNNVVQLRIITPGGLFLLNESFIKVPKEKAENVQFVLSHTCPGGPDEEVIKKIVKKIIIEGDVIIDKSTNIDVHIDKIIVKLGDKVDDFDKDELRKIIKKIIEDELKKKDAVHDDKKDDDKKVDEKKLADTGAPVVGMAALGGLLLVAGSAAMLGIRRRRLNFADADE
jgi:hypothetical protein